jgi:hypothetical protein
LLSSKSDSGRRLKWQSNWEMERSFNEKYGFADQERSQRASFNVSSSSSTFNPNNFDNKAKRNRSMFHRLHTGLQIASYRNQPMRFLTLTTDPKNRKVDRNGKIRSPKDSFDILRQKIERAKIEKDGFQGFKLNKYYCLRTSEGYGVLHIIFWGGRFIPFKWLQDTWLKIHGAKQVNIKFVDNLKRTINGLVGYLLDRYLLNQPIQRMSYGWGWAWLGFCKSWNKVKETYCMMRKGQLTYDKDGKIVYDQWHEEQKWGESAWVKYVPFKKRYSSKPISAWRCLLANDRHTSRQIKFFYPNRGFNKKYFGASSGG